METRSMTAFRMARLVAALGAACALALAAPAAAQAPQRDSLTLYELPDYRGASVTFYGDHAAIGSTGFADRAQSAQVIGTWRLCTGGGFRNQCQVLSGNVRNLGVYGLSRRVGSAQHLSKQAYAPAPRYEDAAPYQSPPYQPPSPYSAPPPVAQAYPLPPVRSSAGNEPYGAPTPGYAPPYDPRYDARPGYGVEPPQPYYGQPYPPPGGPAGGGAPGAVAPPVYGDSAVFFPNPTIRGMQVSATGMRSADDFCRSQGFGLSLYFDTGGPAAQTVDPDGRPTGAGPALRDVLCRRG